MALFHAPARIIKKICPLAPTPVRPRRRAAPVALVPCKCMKLHYEIEAGFNNRPRMGMEILAGIIIGMGLMVVLLAWAMRRELKKLENLT